MRFFYCMLGLTVFIAFSCRNKQASTPTETEKDLSQNQLVVHPIEHATFVLEWNGVVLYVDPVGGKEAFAGQKPADLILITDIHGDHFDLGTLKALETTNAKIILPQAAAKGMPNEFDPQLDVLHNGDQKERFGITIRAIPMYNLREEALDFHPKGRGNGYVLEMADERIYISGDTEDIPEMRALKDLDKAFVCMNLPYTMDVASAADAVLEFEPKEVIPYHYRGSAGLSDVQRFKRIVRSQNEGIQVSLLRWY